MTYEALHDITVRLGEESVDYPGDTPYSRDLVQTMAEGDLCDLSQLRMSAHSGTHIDAPSHFIPGGETLDRYGAGDFILPALVVDVVDPDAVRPHVLEGADFRAGDALLFRTENSTTGRCRSGPFSERFVYLTPELAEACVAGGAALVGADYITIEPYGDGTYPVHRTLMRHGILVLEGIDLDAVPPGRYTLLCLPLNMKDAEASPVRAVLLR